MAQYMERNCSKHGLTLHRKRPSNESGWRCKKCTAEYMIDKHRRNKTRLIKSFGGRCILCGYKGSPNALCFHHRDPSKKRFGISGSTRSYKRTLDESLKCDLLCLNCHAEVHDEFWGRGEMESQQTFNLPVGGSLPLAPTNSL